MGGHSCSGQFCGGEVTFTGPEYSGVGTLSYEVGYSSDGGVTWIFVPGTFVPVDSANLQFATKELTPDEQIALQIVVRASTELAVGPPSAPITFFGAVELKEPTPAPSDDSSITQ
jgi:hypothetical protein